MRTFLLLVIFFFFIESTAFAQTYTGRNAAEILLAMKKLKVCGSVLYIAAHPDDENTRLLTYLSKEKLFRTAYLSLTRGEGGQNLIGDEQGAPLGLIRTQELLAARRIDGAEQFFSSAADFGYSKTKEETLSVWNKETVLKDIVQVIRQFQPQIIVTRFPPDKRAGHGHHAASALLAIEAFDAAADPNIFPDQLKRGLKPWKTKQLFWNTYNFGNGNTITPDQLKIDVGGYNTILGKSYGEIAAESRSQHKSQGFGVPAQRGEQLEYFMQIKGDSCLGDIFNEMPAAPEFGNQTLKYIKLTERLIKDYRADNPESSIPSLIRIHKTLQMADDNQWKTQKLKEILSLIKDCAGVHCEAFTDRPYGIIGDSLLVKAQVIKRSHYIIQLRSVNLIALSQQKKVVDSSLKHNRLTTREFQVMINDAYPVSQPYWLNHQKINTGSKVDRVNDVAENPPSLKVDFELVVDGVHLIISTPVVYKHTDPVKGERYDRLEIIPPYTLRIDPELILLKDTSSVNGIITIRKWSGQLYDTLFPELLVSDKSVNLDPVVVDTFFKKDSEKKISFNLSGNEIGDRLRVSLKHNNHAWNQQMHKIEYDHIPALTYFKNVQLRARKTDLKINGQRIGYIKGAGDHVFETLLKMGYKAKVLNEIDVRNDLSQYDAIVVGVRAYNVHEWISDVHPYLMQFVQKGGVLLVQYNTSSQVGPLKKSNWPYPFSITRNRVSEENAEVTFLDNNHAVFNFPNKITEDDFKGWIQERSVYEANPTDDTFKPLLSMHDKGEDPMKGSLLIANHGKGRIVYTSLSFFRQLPEGVTGACRLFSNLISQPAN